MSDATWPLPYPPAKRLYNANSTNSPAPTDWMAEANDASSLALRREMQAKALEDAADELTNHPRLRKTQLAWAMYPEHMATKEKSFKECADILRDRAKAIRDHS